tara:strand:- start:33 stop:362 length:330 start_codon:yes stop_codon:yes gene_type:complete
MTLPSQNTNVNLKKFGDVIEGASGFYLIYKSIHIGGDYQVFFCANCRYTKYMQFEEMKSFQFKQDAIRHIEELEISYLDSEPYITSMHQSGLLSDEEYKQRISEVVNES